MYSTVLEANNVEKEQSKQDEIECSTEIQSALHAPKDESLAQKAIRPGLKKARGREGRSARRHGGRVLGVSSLCMEQKFWRR